MSLSNLNGLTLADLSTVQALERASLATLAGLSPLPSPAIGETPITGGTMPTPSAYFPFETSSPWPSLVGAATILPRSGAAAWSADAGGLYGNKGLDTSPVQYQEYSADLARTALAVSVWIYDDEAFRIRDTTLGNLAASADGAGFDAWTHWLLWITAGASRRWKNGVEQTELGSLQTGILVFESSGAGIDELAIWESPSWTAEQAATYAAALYNAGLGTVYRDGQWWEIDP